MARQTYLLLLCMGAFIQAAIVTRQEKKPCDKECKGAPLEISFVIDASASIWPDNFTIGLSFLEDFVDLFDISPNAARVSAVTFGEDSYSQDAFGFNDYANKDDLRKAISKIPYRSGQKTNTAAGIRFMMSQQSKARPDVRRVVFVMTDGNSQEKDQTVTAAREARESGLEIFAIGIGHDISNEELHNIATDDRHVFVVNTYRMLEYIKARLAYETCIDIPINICQNLPVDISFVIDSSSSIGESNFTVGMEFVHDFVNDFDVKPRATRVSVVTFSDQVHEDDAFNFDTFTDKKDVLDNIRSIQWRHGGETKTGEGIRYMRTNQIVDARPDAAHIGIVITDGKSQNMDYTRQEAKAARDAGIELYAVGVGILGQNLDENELNDIAGDPSRVLTADNYAGLNLIRQRLQRVTCTGVERILSGKPGTFSRPRA